MSEIEQQLSQMTEALPGFMCPLFYNQNEETLHWLDDEGLGEEGEVDKVGGGG